MLRAFMGRERSKEATKEHHSATETCWKAKRSRHDGVDPDNCPEGMEIVDGKCFEPCPEGFSGTRQDKCW